jgi:hypothetical protein
VVQVQGVPQGDAVQDQPERAELVLHAGVVRLNTTSEFMWISQDHDEAHRESELQLPTWERRSPVAGVGQ